jgi:hypothetical protein
MQNLRVITVISAGKSSLLFESRLNAEAIKVFFEEGKVLVASNQCSKEQIASSISGIDQSIMDEFFDNEILIKDMLANDSSSGTCN